MENEGLKYADADRILKNVLKECNLKIISLKDAEEKLEKDYIVYKGKNNLQRIKVRKESKKKY